MDHRSIASTRFRAFTPVGALRLAVVLGVFGVTSVAGVVAVDGRTPADCASADAAIRVGVVVDFGVLVNEQGAPSSVAARCATVNDGTNGFQILDATQHSYTVNGSGLLCSIDGFPSGGECGQRTETGYRYWAYFHGSNAGWIYAGQGPGGFRVHSPELEGWHFVNGKGNKTDPQPAGPSDPAQVCPTPTTTSPKPTTAPPVPTTAGPSQPGGPSVTTAPIGNAGNAGNAGPGNGPTTSSPSGAPGDPTTSVATDGAAPPDPSGTAPLADGVGGPLGTGVDATGNDDADTAGSRASGDGAVDVAFGATSSRDTPSGAPIGVVAIGLLIASLAAGAVWRFRSSAEQLT